MVKEIKKILGEDIEDVNVDDFESGEELIEFLERKGIKTSEYQRNSIRDLYEIELRDKAWGEFEAECHLYEEKLMEDNTCWTPALEEKYYEFKVEKFYETLEKLGISWMSNEGQRLIHLFERWYNI